ncbi:hypothetical protein XENOCAPTIV_001225 [Xenoophorus captivus]|uniref:Transmembrane protein 238 n=1 Tax=Xenoophorus captivus TaxID=1517983 RepID=A0ABV0QYY3_9TELE
MDLNLRNKRQHPALKRCTSRYLARLKSNLLNAKQEAEISVPQFSSSLIGRCMVFFFIAILLDAVGFVLFFVGIAAHVSYWDFLVLSGPLLMFLSLLCWILWYLGNLEVPFEELSPI